LLRKALVVVSPVFAALVMAGAFLTQPRVQKSALPSRDVSNDHHTRTTATPVLTKGPTADNGETDDDDSDATDLLGNPVMAAVAQYRLDRAGTLYELHSPETELPHLRPPRS
jgi:hypothetical protein